VDAGDRAAVPDAGRHLLGVPLVVGGTAVGVRRNGEQCGGEGEYGAWSGDPRTTGQGRHGTSRDLTTSPPRAHPYPDVERPTARVRGADPRPAPSPAAGRWRRPGPPRPGRLRRWRLPAGGTPCRPGPSPDPTP